MRTIVDLALAQGWDPLAAGEAFGVTAELDGWELYSPTDGHQRYRHYQRLLSEMDDEPALVARVLRDPDAAMAEAAVTWQLDRRAEELLSTDAFPAWAATMAAAGTDFHRRRLDEWSLLRSVVLGEPWSEADVLAASDRLQRLLAERATAPHALTLLQRSGRTRRVRHAAADRPKR